MENTNIQLENGARGTAAGKQPMFIETVDGFGTKVRHLNFDNPEVCKRTGIIQLVPLKLSTRHQCRVGFRMIRDRKNNAVIGIPLYIDPETKRWVYEKINLVDVESFDLTDEEQAKRWAVIRLSTFLEGSPNLSDKPIYKVVDKDREAELYISKRTIKRKAETIAEGLFGMNLIDMARNIGIDPASNSPVTLHAAVIRFAENKPEEFMRIWDSPLRHELTILKRAMSLAIITSDPMIGINYNGIQLGINEPAAVQFLKDNPNILYTIENLTKVKEEESIKSMADNTAPAPKDEKDVMIEALKKELEKQQAANKQMAAKALEKELGGIPSIDDEELVALKEEAKQLGIKGYALAGKETLRKKINEIKQNG